MDTNVVTLAGRATRDTEVKTTTTGTNVANISLAVNGGKDEVSYFDVVVFGKTADVAGKYVVKGKQVIITGYLSQRKWQDKDGNNRYSVEVIANKLQLLGGGEAKKQDVEPNEQDVDDGVDLSEIPF